MIFPIALQRVQHFLVFLFLFEFLEPFLLALQFLEHDDDVREEEDEDLQQDDEDYLRAAVPTLITKR